MRKEIIFLLILLTCSVPAFGGTVYKWGDKDGVVNFTDDPKKVPPEYRDRVETETLEDVPETRSDRPEGILSPKTAQISTDLYGRDEAWWREKVRPLEEQLKQATANYNRVEEKIVSEAQGIVRHMHGGKTQYQMISYRLGRLSAQLEDYRRQILESQERLEDLFRKAEAARADPGWFESRGAIESEGIAPPSNEGLKADLYGRDETWWREKVRPWKEELNESTQNYDRTREEFVRQAEVLGPFNFGRLSLTQYQMISSREVYLEDQMEKDRAGVAEAKEMLKKLSIEAKESQANLDWLN
jgi:hypothetical protein